MKKFGEIARSLARLFPGVVVLLGLAGPLLLLLISTSGSPNLAQLPHGVIVITVWVLVAVLWSK